MKLIKISVMKEGREKETDQYEQRKRQTHQNMFPLRVYRSKEVLSTVTVSMQVRCLVRKPSQLKKLQQLEKIFISLK